VLPQPALDLIASTYPGDPIAELAPTFGGFSHPSALLALGDRQVVAKAAEAAPKRADLRREAHMLGLLRESGLPTAPLLALLENEAWTVEILAFVPGTPGLRLLADAPDRLPMAYSALGLLLSRIHRRKVPSTPPDDLLLAERARATLHELRLLSLGADLQTQFAAALSHEVWHPSAPVMVHGDAGLHNILWHNRISALLDWEWSGFGTPLVDITWVRWTIGWRALPLSLWRHFLDGYAQGAEVPRLDGTALRALALGQIGAILVRVQHDAGACAEWLRRARWTLALDFMVDV
jgi:aminoglycoside phosphotransferase (APT) family kinase protein